MKKECKKFIKKIKQLDEGDCLNYYDNEILCIIPKKLFIIIHDMDMEEMTLDNLLEFIQNNI